MNPGEQIEVSVVTSETRGEFHSRGYAGVSLFAGAEEKMFFGDRNEPSGQWSLEEYGVGFVSHPTFAGAARTVTLIYVFDTGRTRLVEGSDAGGVELLSRDCAPHAAIDAVRIGNGGGGDIAVDKIKVTIRSAD